MTLCAVECRIRFARLHVEIHRTAVVNSRGDMAQTEPPDWDAVSFRVERWIKGHHRAPIGIFGDGFFEARQGMNTCFMSFRGGQRVIFGGKLLPNDAGQWVVYAEDTGGTNPTIFLSDPPTPEQQAQLDYLETITEVR